MLPLGLRPVVLAPVVLGLLVAAAMALVSVTSAVAARTTAPGLAADAQQCPESYPATRDPANPLDLPTAPGANPLTGAHFFVDGPAHGAAAGAIDQLLGINPASQPDSESWAAFAQSLKHGRLHRRLLAHRGLAHKVNELSKIAAEPAVQRVSAYTRGGEVGGVFLQTEKLLCKNGTADPGAIPILNTYFLHPAAGNCPTPAALAAAGPTFRQRVDELAAAVDLRPAVFLLETDGIGGSSCAKRTGALPEWEADLRYEVDTIGALPHAVVYLEAGYSDANSVAYTANVLNASDVQKIRGFYTNDTHLNWTINEVRWATKISRLTGGAHFIVNTATNGRGPLLNRHPSKNGIENLCNPPGRGLGRGRRLRPGSRWPTPGCGPPRPGTAVAAAAGRRRRPSGLPRRSGWPAGPTGASGPASRAGLLARSPNSQRRNTD